MKYISLLTLKEIKNLCTWECHCDHASILCLKWGGKSFLFIKALIYGFFVF